MSGSSIRSRAPVASSPLIRRVMQANYGGMTKPEVLLRSAIHRAGLRFFKDRNPIIGFRCTADIVFPSHKVCVFVDGCFWHGCPIHFRVPKTHTAWWREKINDNRRRDGRQTAQLREKGWLVVRVWEHELDEPELIVRMLAKKLSGIRKVKRARGVSRA